MVLTKRVAHNHSHRVVACQKRRSVSPTPVYDGPGTSDAYPVEPIVPPLAREQDLCGCQCQVLRPESKYLDAKRMVLELFLYPRPGLMAIRKVQAEPWRDVAHSSARRSAIKRAEMKDPEG